ncbi:hypothetical protein EB796_017545 [Bugula neritina]|uniref:Secreted protein n=1 Tax=Bugula neritina TaxID=10212 RepID=A0A7J7JDA0_BUGNE|nr:hypothetical protein EB796_017545 [Bugula neritina]
MSCVPRFFSCLLISTADFVVTRKVIGLPAAYDVFHCETSDYQSPYLLAILPSQEPTTLSLFSSGLHLYCLPDM